MKNILISILVFMLLLMVASCKKEVVEEHKDLSFDTITSKEEYSGPFYTLEDFNPIILDKSTFNDVYNIAPPWKTYLSAAYGIDMCYPMIDGKIILIRISGVDNCVFSIEIVDEI